MSAAPEATAIIDQLAAGLRGRADDAILLEAGCGRTAYHFHFDKIKSAWGAPLTYSVPLLGLLDAAVAGFDEALLAAWRRGATLAYLCWRSRRDDTSELLVGVCVEALLPTLFLNLKAKDAERQARGADYLDKGARVVPRQLPTSE